MPSHPEILQDFADVPTFAKQVNRCETTIERWTKKPDGLPFTKMGQRKLIHIPTARQWLLDRMQRPNPRRRASSEAAPANAA